MSASASYGESSSTSRNTSQGSTSKDVTIAYNFPRVTVLLDEGSLEMTMECQKDLAKVKDAKSLTDFLGDYGEFFSSRVQLGGRLFATEKVEESTSSSDKAEETKKVMKAAASASFGTFSASVSASHDSNASMASSTTSSNAISALTWQARGGDTLLCNDPPTWCPTVADHYYWRVTKQDNVFHLVDFIGKLPGLGGVPKAMLEWRRQAGQLVKPRKFFLNRADRSPVGRFLEADNPVDRSLKRANSLLSWKEGKVTDEAQITTMYGMGSCCLGNYTRSMELRVLKWEVEAQDGDNVDTVQYETPYRLRHPEKGYVDFYRPGPRFLYMTNEKPKYFIVFRDIDGNRMPRTIPNGADVLLHFIKEDFKEKSFVYILCEETGWQYLAVSPKPEGESQETYKPIAPVKMKIRWA